MSNQPNPNAKTNTRIFRYCPHESTIRVAGSTDISKAVNCAMHFLAQSRPIDFLYMGAEAGHKAVKIMSIVRHIVADLTQGKGDVFLQPFEVEIETAALDGTKQVKTACCWKLAVLDAKLVKTITISES